MNYQNAVAKKAPSKGKKQSNTKSARPGSSNSIGLGADRFTPSARGRPEMSVRREECSSCGRVVGATGACGCT
jgi:hypothetical protein